RQHRARDLRPGARAMGSRNHKVSPTRAGSAVRSSRTRAATIMKGGMVMEAKVDVAKLQLLNDRINQTIDALNQVRLSVHGLAHAGINPYATPGLGYGTPMGFTTNPVAGYPGVGGPLGIGFGPGTFGQPGVSPFGGLGQ